MVKESRDTFQIEVHANVKKKRERERESYNTIIQQIQNTFCEDELCH